MMNWGPSAWFWSRRLRCIVSASARIVLVDQLDRIRDIVIRTIAPDSWIDNGGVGSIELIYQANAMVVRNTPEVHTMIDSDFRLEDAIPTPAQRSARIKTPVPPPAK